MLQHMSLYPSTSYYTAAHPTMLQHIPCTAAHPTILQHTPCTPAHPTARFPTLSCCHSQASVGESPTPHARTHGVPPYGALIWPHRPSPHPHRQPAPLLPPQFQLGRAGNRGKHQEAALAAPASGDPPGPTPRNPNYTQHPIPSGPPHASLPTEAPARPCGSGPLACNQSGRVSLLPGPPAPPCAPGLDPSCHRQGECWLAVVPHLPRPDRAPGPQRQGPRGRGRGRPGP